MTLKTAPYPALDAAAVVLVRASPEGREVFWVRRSREVSLGGGFFAFPGGRVDEADRAQALSLGMDAEAGRLRVAALRELFEETGVLLAAPLPDAATLSEARRLLLSGKRSFADVLEGLGARLEADGLHPAGRWLTPPFLPRRYDTHFFAAPMPQGQAAEVWPGELVDGEWIATGRALGRWSSGAALLHPPALHLLRCLDAAPMPDCLPAMCAPPHMTDWVPERVEFQEGIFLLPLRTPTLPPATHTNCYLVGEGELVVIDPASPYEEEQRRLLAFCRGLLAEGRRFREILLTHEHHDHVGGANALREALGIPVRAHEETARRLGGRVRVDGFVAADERIRLPGRLGLCLRAVFTPGHARGHLCFFEERTGALITGDMVAGVGSIVVDPPEGDMADYVASLRLLRSLPVGALYPAHGPALPDGPGKLDAYLAHRAEREAQVFEALAASGGATPEQLVPRVYADVPEPLYPLAARSLLAVLEKLVKEGRASVADGVFRAGGGR